MKKKIITPEECECKLEHKRVCLLCNKPKKQPEQGDWEESFDMYVPENIELYEWRVIKIKVKDIITQELAKQEVYKGKQKREYYQMGVKEERARLKELTGKINIIEPPEDVEKLPDKRSAFLAGQMNILMRLFDISEALKD